MMQSSLDLFLTWYHNIYQYGKRENAKNQTGHIEIFVVNKEAFLSFQLLWDILSVSEATDWSTDATVIAKYQALGCHISLVNQSTEEFTKLQEMVVNSLGTGGSVHNIYRVRRTIEEVNFQTDIGEIQMLMHSSLFSNYLGILSRGLILPNVVTDKMGVSRTDAGLLGAGIYFTDSAKLVFLYLAPCSLKF